MTGARGRSAAAPAPAFFVGQTYTAAHVTSLKFVLPTAIAAILGFMLGWSLEFGRLMDVHRPDGCDGPCIFAAGEYYDDALWGGLVGALVLGLFVFGLVMVVFARRRPPGPSRDST